MDVSNINTPQELGKALKAEFKKMGIDIRTTYKKTVRGLDGSWYEISTFRSGHIIPNDFRKQSVSLIYGKPFEEMGVRNPDDIHFGNTEAHRVSMFGRLWKKWLAERP